MERPLCVSATLIGPKKTTVEKTELKLLKNKLMKVKSWLTNKYKMKMSMRFYLIH